MYVGFDLMLNQPSPMIETLWIPCFSKWWGTIFWGCLIYHGSMCGPAIHDPCPHGTASLEISRLVCSHFNDESTDNILQFSSVAHLCPTLYDPMDCSMPGFPVHYQTHVRWVSDAIQPSHCLSSPSPLAFNLSQHQGLCQWVGSSHQMVKTLEFQLQDQSFQWIFGADFL